MNISEIEHTMNVLIYGEPGTGKTYLAGSACLVKEMCPILWLDTEKGILTVKDGYKDHLDKFIYEPAMEYQVVSDTYFKLLRGDGKTYEDSQGNEHPWPKTVVIDNMSELQKISMRRIMQKVVKEDSDRDIEVPGIREWGKVLEQMRVLIRSYRDLDMNTIFTAWAHSDTDLGRTTTYPGLQGKMGKDVAGYIDVVGYLYVKTEEDQNVRKLLTDRHGGTIAKARGSKLPKVLENPTMEDIYENVVR